jgi:hypothetical protein
MKIIESKDFVFDASILRRLEDDDDYYGEFGKQFMSNSNIKVLLENPLALDEPVETTIPMVIGKFFHQRILEPDKAKNVIYVDASTRTTKIYKDTVEMLGQPLMLKSEYEHTISLTEKVLEKGVCLDLIRGIEGDIQYEVPSLIALEGLMFKCKADIVNHEHRLIVDLKTTSDINHFRKSAYTYNYDSQAYIYSRAFGYDFMFIVVCKKTGTVGIYDCSKDFLMSGEEKVKKAVETYRTFYGGSFDPTQYVIGETL